MWSGIVIGSLPILTVTWSAALLVESRITRNLLRYLVPLSVVVLSLVCGSGWNAYARLFASAVLLYAVKGGALLHQSRSTVRTMPLSGFLVFSLFWPGVDPGPFTKNREPQVEDHVRFAGGLTRALMGGAIFLVVAGNLTHLNPNAASWLGTFSILLTAHLGISGALPEAVRALGWRVPLLFDQPHRSRSLSDFWSHRWNRPFIEMNRIFFMPWLTQRFGLRAAVFCVFLISGLLHEFEISFQAMGGWGGPLLYFALQGILVFTERKLHLRGPAWTGMAVLVPLPILFHEAFRHEIVLPYLTWTHHFMASIGIRTAASWLIVCLGIAQLVVLAASFQVPTRLRWREELPRLGSLNSKLMWTYGSFIVFTITSWGILTLVLREDILNGTKAGVSLCIVIALFWGFRLLTDAFYFRSDDWPKGPFMQIGHVTLNYLFTFVLLGYAALLAGHFFGVLS